MAEETTFERRIRERQEEKARQASAPLEIDSAVPATELVEPDLVPDGTPELSEEDREMDTVMETVRNSGIVNLYNRWNSKSFNCVPRTGQRESIKVKCPLPNHYDEHPSAWLNADKNVWYCGTCDEGGDFYDLAAIKWSYYDYKTSGNSYHELRRAIAADFGYTFQRKVYGSGYHIIEPDSTEPEAEVAQAESLDPTVQTEPAEDASAVPVSAPVEKKLAVVTALATDDSDDDDDKSFYANSREVDAGAFIKEDTFLAEWVKQTYLDPAPNDYSFWHGLVALGLAAGRDVFFADPSKPVWGNLFLCLLGPSGVGKSRSQRHLFELLKGTNTIWKDTDDPPRGVKLMGTPVSGEVVVRKFQYVWAPDPTNPKDIYPLTVKGLLEFNEYSQLNALVSRQGSQLGQTLMKVYDAESYISSDAITSGEKFAHEPFGSLVTTTQPRSLRRLISQSSLDSGFANRFIFVTGIPKEYDEFDVPYVDLRPTFSKYSAIVQWCQAGSPTSVWFDDDARAYANGFWKHSIKPLVQSGDNDLTKRLGLVMKKIILLNAINEMETVVTHKMLDRSLSLFEYIVRAYGVSADRIGETKLGEIERLIIQAVEAHQSKNKSGMTPSEFRRKFHRRKFETADVVRVFENLVKLGELDRVETKTAGKVGAPTIRYKVAT